MNNNNAKSADNEEMNLVRVIPCMIGEHLCYPRCTCVHLNFPGEEQLNKNLARYRQKEILIHIFDNANNFDSSDEELHSKLFGEKQDGIRITLEYINMMIQQLGGQEFLVIFPKNNVNFQELANFYEINGSLPLSAVKSIIRLFRKVIMYDSAIEEVQLVQKSSSRTSAEV